MNCETLFVLSGDLDEEDLSISYAARSGSG